MLNRIMPLALAVLCGCTVSEQAPPQAANTGSSSDLSQMPPAPPASREVMRTRIDPGVFDPYTRKNFPKLFAKIGTSGLPERIQALRIEASFRALESQQCDRVELAEISLMRSNRGDLAVFVDCRNGQRFNMRESDLKDKKSTLLPNSMRRMSRQQAIELCTHAARGQTLYPALFSTSLWAGAAYGSDQRTGNAWVEVDFTAKNALGMEIPYRARCTFPIDSQAEIAIAPR